MAKNYSSIARNNNTSDILTDYTGTNQVKEELEYYMAVGRHINIYQYDAKKEAIREIKRQPFFKGGISGG